MPKSSIDHVKLSIVCPACSKQFKEAFARLKRDPLITCPGCGRAIQIEGGAAVNHIDRTMEGGLAGLRRRIREQQKRLG